jgi:hypothetical protein
MYKWLRKPCMHGGLLSHVGLSACTLWSSPMTVFPPTHECEFHADACTSSIHRFFIAFNLTCMQVFRYMEKFGLPDETCMPYSATDFTKFAGAVDDDGNALKTCPGIGNCSNCMPIDMPAPGQTAEVCWAVTSPLTYSVRCSSSPVSSFMSFWSLASFLCLCLTCSRNRKNASATFLCSSTTNKYFSSL